MSYTLLIIDMQAHFPASKNGKTIKACTKQIKQAIYNGYPIVFVEFLKCGQTLRCLANLAKDYDRTFTFLKDKESGAIGFEHIVEHYNLPRNIRVCGVNTDQCVLATVRDLSSGVFCIKNISVVKDACNTNTDRGTNRNEFGLEVMASLTNVKVI